ncbi:hypothetical protein, partial [Yersinia pseudotuberculosis]|uniref:hypothetical protein n=1 Tax=Yersinia pseudotuberculosis TaxID=633 RepID=UPI001A9E3D6E
VRTLDTLTRIHTFQACSFSHSDTSPCLLLSTRLNVVDRRNVGKSLSSVNPLLNALSLFS